jgi:hypothetical protein
VKTLFLAAVAIVPLFAWGSPAKALHFSDSADVVCGSEKTVRQHYYEYENGLPLTVLRESNTFRGGAGASCVINVMQLAHPQLALVVRHDAFCAIRVVNEPKFPVVEKATFWVHCLSLKFD